MTTTMNNVIAKAKRTIKKNSNKLWLVGVSVATLGGTYYYGKSKGEQIVEVYIKPAPDAEYIRLSDAPPDE
jgi:hypothetical protein